MYQMENFQASTNLSKNYYSFFNITRNLDGFKATVSYLINVPFEQIKLQTYCILYISYYKQYFHLADNFSLFHRFPERKAFFCSSDLGYCVSMTRVEKMQLM